VSSAAFAFMELRYSLLLGLLVGFSVLIPYIGAAVVTIPVAVVGLFQFGLSSEFGYLMLVYFIIQALDGNLLVPILFSEAVSLHPLYIIIAVLVFGGMWGFWGVFFAIPLATLVKAVITAWSTPTVRIDEQKSAAE
jgi:putative permease